MNSFYSEMELKEIGFKSIGKNVMVSRKTSIYMPENIKLGNDVRIDDYCCLVGGKKGIEIGSNVHIAFHCIILGNGGVIINDFAGLSSRVSIYSATDDYSGESLTNPTIPSRFKIITEGEVCLGKHVIIGTNSTILPNVSIGEGCSVGANSLVTKSLNEWGVYFGSPARRIKDRSRKMLELEKDYIDYKELK
ncbi:acyltransferase [Ammoniphilus sp. 3BR4]|uniref:acyltransferase n=1 Tax=Ammoniphilus sp. 3BR4 TaxID=3158265 RepID=UPI003467B03F